MIATHEERNLWVLAMHFVVMRIAWIFKVESVIVPAFLDTIAGPGWVRGCLPILNRIGQSIPPLVLAPRLRSARQKKWALLLATLGMAAPFLVLSGVWIALDRRSVYWLTALFLGLYLVFFTMSGLSGLAYGTLQGKLIRAERRGRLMAISSLFGSIAAILCAWLLLPRWLLLADGGFGYIFALVGALFIGSALIAGLVKEPVDTHGPPVRPAGGHLDDAIKLFTGDRRFRRLAIVAMLFSMSLIVFPHYQALGRARLSKPGLDMMYWVIAQNAGAGLFGIMAGWLADRRGNRLALRWEIFAAALTPVLAVLLAADWFPGGRQFFWLVFFTLGLIATAMKTLVNYTLEIAPEAEHPRYVSTLSMFLALPFVASPAVGWLIDTAGFTPVLLAVSGLMLLGFALTFTMDEPRHDHAPPK